MALESFSGIWSLNTSNPTATDDINQGDDHIRGIKQSIRQSFPNISATVNVAHTALNHLSGIDSNIKNSVDALSLSLQAEITRTDALSASLAAEISRTDTLSQSFASNLAYGSIFVTGLDSEFSATTSLSLFTNFDVPGVLNLVAAGTATGALVVTNAGHYEMLANLSISSSAAVVVTAAIYVDDATTNIQSKAAIPAGGQAVIPLSGIATAGASGRVQVRLQGDVTTLINVSDAQLSVKRTD